MFFKFWAKLFYNFYEINSKFWKKFVRIFGETLRKFSKSRFSNSLKTRKFCENKSWSVLLAFHDRFGKFRSPLPLPRKKIPFISKFENRKKISLLQTSIVGKINSEKLSPFHFRFPLAGAKMAKSYFTSFLYYYDFSSFKKIDSFHQKAFSCIRQNMNFIISRL